MPLSSPHAPVLALEAIAALRIHPAGTYVDCTFGRGGHSRLILERLGSEGRLVALDRDPQAEAVASEIRDPRFRFARAPFSRLAGVLQQLGIESVHGVLLDLGVSSPQLEDPARGFSFLRQGPLDMRMDPHTGVAASEWLAAAPEAEIAEVIKRYGEERFARRVARAIVGARAVNPIGTTRELADIVSRAVPTREPNQHPATRTFQALRIHVNRELQELEQVLPQCLELLLEGGRLVALSFHSLEDRLVKRFLAQAASPEPLPEKLPVPASALKPPRLRLVGKIRPSAAEIEANPRARSAMMRIAEKLG
ncbi:MAG TPA: 16S rRNA (cytosine(1402)-N(4))-methyltransferase RsmH [Burkholderiales bacterium]|nr:16S rRNA (cytosine(1402)-N(4))-methyltransferase RsmH [Burkholderiales bacterium]